MKDLNHCVGDLVPVARAICTEIKHPIPITKLSILGCLVKPKSTEYLCQVGTAVFEVVHYLGITSRWTADQIKTEEEYVNSRIRFLGTGAHEED